MGKRMKRATPVVPGAALAVALAAVVPGGLAGRAAAMTPASMEDRSSVVLQGLDKTTARVSTFELPVGQTVRFGTLLVAARGCRQAPPIEPPESAAFVQVDEQKPGEPPSPLFSGWMFASSPALSALEHPVYDVWVLGCGTGK